MNTRLPLVEDVRIATPCHVDWDEMAGNEQVRFCGKCDKNVYNLSRMTRVEAERLVREREGRMCVRFYRRPDGTMLTADCPVAVERHRLRRRLGAWLSRAAAFLMLIFGVGSARADLIFRDGKKRAPGVQKTVLAEKPPLEAFMGDVVAEPRPSPRPAPRSNLPSAR